MISCKTFLSLNSQSPVECLPITANHVVSLCQTGVTSRDSAVAILQLDEHDELVVVRLAETPVTLERAGRRVALRTNKPIRICEKDTLWIDNTSIEIVKSTFVITKPAPKSTLIQTARKVVAASAAVFSMVAFAACEEDGCNDGQQKCKNNDVYICANNSWNLLEKCGSDQVCSESSNTSAYCEMAVHPGEPIEECTPNEMKCDNKDVLKCVDGLWSKVETCSDTCLENSNTSAVCDYSHVEGDILPDPGFDIPQCTANEMKCQNNNVYQCEGGEWILKTECDDGACHEVSNTSAVCRYDQPAGEPPESDDPPIIDPDVPDQCTVNEMKCENNNVLKCVDGDWKLSEECNSNETCVELSNTSAVCELGELAGEMPLEECLTDDMKCEDNKVYKCVDGNWKLEDECLKDAICIQQSNTSAFCDMGPTSGVLPPEECAPKEMKCEDNTIYKCVDGSWEIEEKCVKDAVCIEKSNTSAVCEVEILEGEPMPPDIPTPDPIKPPEEDE